MMQLFLGQIIFVKNDTQKILLRRVDCIITLKPIYRHYITIILDVCDYIQSF